MGDPSTAKIGFLEELREQRWDDHRFYHQCRINQSLHFFSALCFLFSYVMLPIDPVIAIFVGWLLAWTSRQAGHFFFEPKGHDTIYDVSHEHKESIKIGYNLTRKIGLLSAWIAAPLLLVWQPTLFGVFEAHASFREFLEHLAFIWLIVGLGALFFRTVQLFVIRDVQTGLVWFTKILTDPFNDVRMYHKSPLLLLKGERYDPMTEEMV